MRGGAGSPSHYEQTLPAFLRIIPPNFKAVRIYSVISQNILFLFLHVPTHWCLDNVRYLSAQAQTNMQLGVRKTLRIQPTKHENTLLSARTREDKLNILEQEKDEARLRPHLQPSTQHYPPILRLFNSIA